MKVVEHAAFRAARAAFDAPLTVLRLPVVSLNVPAATTTCGRTTLTNTVGVV